MNAIQVPADPPELRGGDVVLKPLDETYFDDTWRALQDPATRRLTHTHARFTTGQVRAHLASLRGRSDRADWAITAVGGGGVPVGTYLGEVVLHELDADNESMGFRIALAGPHVFGRGYGTQATGLVLDFAFGALGLYRVSLDVVAYNPRARRAYEKCGFVVEGVLREAIRWAGARHDNLVMAVLATDPRPPAPR